MIDTTENKLDPETIKKLQLGVIAGLAHHGQTLLHQIKDIITDDCFDNDKGKFYFKVIKGIAHEDLDVDETFFEHYAIYLHLEEYFKANKETLLDGLKKILDYKISEKNAIEYAKILARRLYKIKTAEGLRELADILDTLPDNTTSIDTSNHLVEFVRKSSPKDQEDEISKLGATVHEFVDDLLNSEPSLPGLPNGFPLFARGTGGLTDGTVTCVASRTKIGKSLWCLANAINVAQLGIPVLYLDKELEKKQVMIRVLANLSKVAQDDIKYKTFNQNDEMRQKVQEATEILHNMPLYWHKSSVMNIDQCLSYAQRWLAREVGFNDDGTAKQCLFVFDYIKLSGDLGSNTSKKEWELLGEMANKLKEFACQYSIPILTAAQLNRSAANERGGDGAIAGSDQIARYVDTVWYLSKKTDTEIAQDNADFGDYCGNVAMTQIHVRNAESLHRSNYLALDLNTRTVTFEEKGYKFDFSKPKTPQRKSPKNNNDINVPS